LNMSNGNDTIKKILEVEDKFTDPLNDFKEEIKAIAKASDKAEDDVEDLNDEIQKTGTNASKATPKAKKLSNAFGDMKSSVVGLVSAYIGLRGLEMAKDLAILSAEAESVAISFDNMARSVGFSGEELTNAMRESTDNMISDVALQKNAMKALISGIDPQAMLVSMQYVSRYAQSVGGDAEQLMQTVMTGLARGSAQFLDDVGIQVMGSTDVVGDAVDQMKEKMLELNETPFTKIRKFETSMENLKIKIGDELVPSVDILIGLFSDLSAQAEQLGLLEDALDSVRYATAIFASPIIGIVGVIDALFVSTELGARATMGIMTRLAIEGLSVYQGIAEATSDIELLPDSLQESANRTADALADKLGLLRANLAQNDADVITTGDALIERVEKYGTAIDKLWGNDQTSSNREQAQRRQIQTIEDQTEATNEQVKANEELLHSIDKIAFIEQQRANKQAEDRAKAKGYREQEEADELARIEARREMVSQAITTAGDMASAISSIHDSRMEELQREFDYEEEGIKNSTMSRKKKEKALEQLADKRKKAEIESAKRQVVFATLTGASNTALAIQAQVLTIIRSMSETSGGVAMRIGAGIAMAGATAGYISQIKSAQASIPKREFGGVARRNELYEVAERNKDEMFQSGGKNYFMPSSGGRVTPDVQSGGNTVVNMNITFGAGTDTQTIEQRLPSMIAKGLEMADRQGEVRYERMPNFQREMGN
jgi:hypothetical protein